MQKNPGNLMAVSAIAMNFSLSPLWNGLMDLMSCIIELTVMAWNIPCSFVSFLHNKDSYFGSFLVDSGGFQLNGTTLHFY